MKINLAIDARPLSLQPTGIGRYTEEILSRLQTQVDCSLFSDKNIITQLKNVRLYPFSGAHIPRRLKKSVLWQQLLLPKTLRQSRCDLFWSPRHHLPLLGCKKVPMVLTIHDLVYRKMPETMKRSNWILEKLLLAASVKRADHVIAISQATRQSLIEELKTPEHKISVIHSGYFQIPAVSAQARAKPYILFLGTLEPRKNIERLVDAYLGLPQYLQDEYDLVLAGGRGWKSETLFSKIATSPHINALGFVNDIEAATLLRNATCFAFPSLYEGFGLPILEAMAAGTPVLTSNDPACVEVSGDAALHVDSLSVESISHHLQTLLEDAHLRQSLVQKGFENIKRFSWDTAAAAHLKVFQGIKILID